MPVPVEKTVLEIFVENWIPIIQCVVIIFGGIAGLWKYFKEKNKETYIKLLSEVYAPLYQYFVKQELVREIVGMSQDYHETPVIELKSQRTSTTISQNGFNQTITDPAPVLELNRAEFMKALDSVNIGLASKELYSLLSMYKVTIFFVGFSNKTDD
jgi:hypothetical protein